MVNKLAVKVGAFTLVALGVTGVLWAQSKETKSAADTAAEAAVKASGANHTGRNHQAFHDQAAKDASVIMSQAEMDEETKAFLMQDHRVDEQMRIHGDWARQELERAGLIVDGVMRHAAAGGHVPEEDPADMPKRSEYIVYVSQSMGKEGLRQIFEYGRGREDVAYVFRGFLPGQDMGDFIKYVSQFQGKDESELINISLDPPSFVDNNIKTVPTIVYYDDSEQVIARVTGLANYGWLKDRVKRGERGDFGRRGEAAYPINEEDLIEVMKQRAAQIDIAAESERAINDYFRNLPTIELPYAEEQRVRKVAPLLMIEHDVVDHEGVVRYQRGQVVDMKEELVHAPMLVVFNSQDPAHREFAKIMGEKADPQRQVIYMTTHIDRDGGVSGYAQQEYDFGRPIFLLMEDVKSTFGIERIPTVVTPTDKEFVVVEVPLKDWRKN